jgi:hypothetical protein
MFTTRTDPEWDQTEHGAEVLLQTFSTAHRGHDGPGVMNLKRVGGRMTHVCNACNLMCVGPSYVRLNRGAKLTKFGLAIRELGEAADPEDKAFRLGWEAADRGITRTPALDAALTPMFAGMKVGDPMGTAFHKAWFRGWGARMEPEQTIIGERAIGAPV